MKRTSALALLPDFESTFSTESPPLFFAASLCSTQLSATEVTVTVPAVQLETFAVQVPVADVGSGLPAASIARTRNVCGPAVIPVSCFGDVHAAYGARSSEHSNVEPGSSEANVIVSVVLVVVPDGPLIVVSGASRSSIQVYVAGLGSTLPAKSIARTWNVCEPCARSV